MTTRADGPAARRRAANAPGSSGRRSPGDATVPSSASPTASRSGRDERQRRIRSRSTTGPVAVRPLIEAGVARAGRLATPIDQRRDDRRRRRLGLGLDRAATRLRARGIGQRGLPGHGARAGRRGERARRSRRPRSPPRRSGRRRRSPRARPRRSPGRPLRSRPRAARRSRAARRRRSAAEAHRRHRRDEEAGDAEGRQPDGQWLAERVARASRWRRGTGATAIGAGPPRPP